MNINVLSVEPGVDGCKVLIELDGKQYTYMARNKEGLIASIKADIALASDQARLTALVGQSITL